MAPLTRLVLAIVAGAAVLAVPGTAAAMQVGEATWTTPVNAPIWGGFLQPAYHRGVDLGAERYVPIRAASAGTVIVRKCNAHIDGESYSCDIDGSPTVKGCGWYVDIQHAAGNVTRYCHMVLPPLVNVGDVVQTGQRIGYVGSSGNSSAPHLHFEVHLVPRGAVASNENAVDPVLFMAVRGAPLGIGHDAPEPPLPSDPGPAPELPVPPAEPVPHDPRADVDGDGATDPVVWRAIDGMWYVPAGDSAVPIGVTRPDPDPGLTPTTPPALEPVTLGLPGDLPVVADYDGDGVDDLAVWRPSDGRWLVQASSGAAVSDPVLGTSQSVPLPGDYDGDGRDDFAVWRPFPGDWIVLHADGTETGPVEIGVPGDLPVVGDFDGDGRDDFAVWRPDNGQWLIQASSGVALPQIPLGAPGDYPVTGDFDGDGLYDFAVWRATERVFFVRLATSLEIVSVPLAAAGDEPGPPPGDVTAPLADDIPVIGDYDGDGRDDLAVWRASEGRWVIRILPPRPEPSPTPTPSATPTPAPTPTQEQEPTVIEIVLGTTGDIPVNRPLWLDDDGTPLTLADILARRTIIVAQLGGTDG